MTLASYLPSLSLTSRLRERELAAEITSLQEVLFLHLEALAGKHTTVWREGPGGRFWLFHQEPVLIGPVLGSAAWCVTQPLRRARDFILRQGCTGPLADRDEERPQLLQDCAASIVCVHACAVVQSHPTPSDPRIVAC